MRKRIVLVTLLSVLCTALLGAEDLEKVLAKNMEIRGGEKALKAVKTLKLEGKMVIMGKLECPLKVWWRSPDKLKMESEMFGKDMIQAFNGETMWWLNPKSVTGKPEKMKNTDDDEFFETLRPLCLNTLLRARDQLEYEGAEKLDGAKVHKVKLVERDDKTVRFYLDGETGIELKIVTEIKSGKDRMVYESELGSYREVEGVVFPFSVDLKFMDPDSDHIVKCGFIISKLEVNEEVKDELFEFPEEEEQQQKEEEEVEK